MADGSADQERIREALRESEARFKAVFDLSVHCVFLADFEGRFLDLNQAALDLLGYQREEISTLTLESILSETDVPRLRQRMAETIAAGPKEISGEWRLRRKDGSHVFVESRSAVIYRDGKPFGIQGVARDVTELKRAERALRESEAKFRALFENAGDAIILMTCDGANVDCNLRAAEVFGYATREEFLLQRPVDRVPERQPDGRDSVKSAHEWFAAAGSGTPQRFEWMHKRRDGTLFLCDVTLSSIEMEGGVLLQAIIRDVTERKRIEEEREHALATLEAALAQSPSGIVIADAPDVTIRWANAAAFSLRGDAQRQLTGIGFRQHSSNWQLFRPDGSEYPPEELPLSRAIFKGESSEGVEFIIRDSTGLDHWVLGNAAPIRNSQGEIVSAIVVFQDITERRRVEMIQRESDARFRTLFDLIPYSMSVRDLEGRILDGNARLCKASGMSRQDLAGHFSTDFFEMRYAAGGGENVEIDGAFLRASERCPIELVVRNRATGEVRTVLFSAVSINLEGKPCYLTSSFDITELRRVEQQFRQAQKMEAIGRLAGGVAHDFNNLLTVIGGYTDLALLKLPEEDDLRGSLIEVRKAAEQAATLTRQLLAFSRNQALAPASVDLNVLIADTAKMLGRLVGEGVELSIQLGDRLPSVRVDAGQTAQVLMNLVVNAKDAMPDGGRILIATGIAETGDERARSLSLEPGTYVSLRVEDTGTGMDEETQSHIFEPFFTTKPVGEGTGLGLSTVYGIVKQSGGSIAVSSQPGAGTVFEILLPAITSVETTGERRGAHTNSPTGTETVLVAEDDAAIRDLALKVLRQAGYVVLGAADGADALTVFRSAERPIDLLVTDLIMPKMGGLDLAGTMRKERPGLAVLFMSGYSSGRAMDAVQADATTELITKPFSPGSLLKQARRVLDARRPA